MVMVGGNTHWSREWTYLLIGLLIVSLVLAYVEVKRPYHFTRDDNLDQFLPVTLEGIHQMMNGTLPAVNMHQLMGVPLLEMGTYPVLYPPTWMSYGISVLLGNEQLLIEVFVILHIILGFVATYFFLRTKNVMSWIATMGSLGFVFSGYVFIASREWYYLSPTVLFLPLIFILHDRMMKKGTWGSVLLLGGVRALYFYSGNAQYYIYALFFEFLYLLFNQYQNGWKLTHVVNYLLSMLFTALFAAPLALPLIEMSQRSSVRGFVHPFKYIFSRGVMPLDILKGALLPYPLVKMTPHFFSLTPPQMIHMFYSGYLFGIAFIVGGIYLLLRHGRAALKQIDPLFWLGIISSLLAMGYRGGLHALMVILPFWNKLLLPFKISLFVNFFIAMFGAIVFQHAFSHALKRKRTWARYGRIAIIVLFIGLFAYHITIARPVSFVVFKDTAPASWPINITLDSGRTLGILAEDLRPCVDYVCPPPKPHEQLDARFMQFDFATLFGYYTLTGYEPLRATQTYKTLPLRSGGLYDVIANTEGISEYGVKWVLLPTVTMPRHTELSSFPVAYADQEITILENPHAKPYVFAPSSPDENISHSLLDNGVSFTTNFSNETDILVNVIYYDNYRATTATGKMLPVTSDAHTRIVVSVPPGEQFVRVVYTSPRFVLGVALAAAGLVAALLLSFFWARTALFVRRLERLLRSFWRRQNNRRRTAITTVCIVVFLIIIGGLLVHAFLGKDVLRSTVEARIDLPLDVASLSYSFPDTAVFDTVVAENPGGFLGDFFRIDTARVVVNTSPILSLGWPRMQEITLNGIEMNLTTISPGVSNYATLSFSRTRADRQEPWMRPPIENPPADTLITPRLDIIGGTIVFKHYALPALLSTERLELRDIRLVATNVTFNDFYHENKKKKRLLMDSFEIAGVLSYDSVSVPVSVSGRIADDNGTLQAVLDIHTVGLPQEALDALITVTSKSPPLSECDVTTQSDCYDMLLTLSNKKESAKNDPVTVTSIRTTARLTFTRAPYIWIDAEI